MNMGSTSVKRIIRFFRKAVCITGSLAAVLSLTNCDNVGLGDSVDTEAPTLAITYPPASAVIRGTFTLAGSCDDDEGVTSVKVTVTNTDTSVSYGTFDAAIAEDKKSWTVSLNAATSDTTYNGWTFPDGTYKCDVAASDGAGHSSGTGSRSFAVDNTAPVFIVSKPLAVGSASASVYGQTIKLTGDLSDRNSVSSLVMHIYRYGTSLSSAPVDLPVSGFTALSSDNPLIIARYYTESAAAGDTSKETLRSNYLTIYGSDADTSKEKRTYYCGIELMDNAKTYTSAGDSGTGSGNTSTVYYINNDTFYDTLLKENSSYKLTVKKLMYILDGTDTEYTSEQKNAIKAVLSTSGNFASSTSITTSSSSKFSVNPNNDPLYYVSGYVLGSSNTSADSTTGYAKFSPGGSLTVNFEAGADSIAIVPSTISVLAYDMGKDNELTGSYAYKDTDYTDNPYQTILAAGTWTEEAAATLQKTFSNDVLGNITFTANHYYRIVVSGSDREGNSLEPSSQNGYGFKVKSNNDPPVILFNSTEDTIYSGTTAENNGVVLGGTIKTNNIDLDGISAVVTVTDTSDNSTVGTTVVNPQKKYTTASAGTAYSYTFTVTLSKTDGYPLVSSTPGKYKYKVAVTAQDMAGTSATESQSFFIDNKGPNISISSLSPYIQGTGSNSSIKFVNGKITITGKASDKSDVASVTYAVYDGTYTDSSAVSALTPISLSDIPAVSGTDNWSIADFDTTKLATGTTQRACTIAVTASDKAKTTANTSTVLYNITVDQTTDAPVITLNNANTSITDVAGIKNAYIAGNSITNLFGTSSNTVISGTVTDDDGINTVTITYYSNSALSTVKKTDTKTVGGSTSYTFSSAVPSSASQYYVVITALDSKQDTTGYNNVREPSASGTYFMIGVTSGVPVVTVTSQSSAWHAANTAISVEGTVSTDTVSTTYPLTLVRYSDSGYSAAEDNTTQTLTASGHWSDSISQEIVGTSGSIKYYKVTDAYGQAGKATFTYNVDSAPPTFTVTHLGSSAVSLSGNSAAEQTVYFKKNEIYTIQGTVSDTGSTQNSGVEGMYYYVSASAPGNSNDTVYTPDISNGWISCGTSTWTASIDLSASTYTDGGTYGVYLAAKDIAGNFSLIASNPSAKIKLIPDGTAPVSSLTSTLDSETAKTGLYDSTGAEVASSAIVSDGTVSYYAKAAFTLSGTVTETFLNTAVLKVSKNGNTPSQYTLYSAASPESLPTGGAWTNKGNGTYAWSYSQSATSADGTYVYTLILTDKAGNTSSKVITVCVDTTNPVLSVISPASGEAVTGSYTFSGTVSDAGCGVGHVFYTLKKGSETIADGSTATVTGSSWASSQLSFTSEGTYTLSVTASDYLGHSVSSNDITFYYDAAPPVLTETVTNTPANYGIGTSGKVTNTNFALYGTVSDTNALASSHSVTVVDKVGDATVQTYYPVPDSTSGIWYVYFTPTGTTAATDNTKTDENRGNSTDGIHTYTITATDIVGKTTVVTRSATVDKTIPVWYTDSTDNKAPYLPTAKYSKTESEIIYKYYNTTSITMNAKAADATSGVANLEYNLVNSQLSSTEYQTAGNGNFVITGAEGLNTLKVRAADAAGNKTSDFESTFYIDTTAPSSCSLKSINGNSDNLTETKLVNGTSDLSFIFSASDAVTGLVTSGVKSVELSKIGSKPISNVSGSLSTDDWTITIPAASLATGTVTVKVTDNCGNSAEFALFDLQLDATKPVVSITSPAASATVNKTVTVSGTASDNISLASATLYVGTVNESGVITYDSGNALTVNGSGAWTTEINTTVYNDGVSDSKLYLKVSAFDTAGNSTDVIQNITVNQDGDRPEIKITYLTLSNMSSSKYIWLKNTTMLYGSVIDDDGAITSLTAKYTYENDTKKTGSLTAVLDSGSFTLDLSKAVNSSNTPYGDGKYKLQFIVTDKAGTEFTAEESATVDTQLLKTPKITDGTNKYGYSTTSSNSITYLQVATKAPDFYSVGVSTDSNATKNTTGWITSTYSTSLTGKLGGTKAKIIPYTGDSSTTSGTSAFSLQVITRDPNGIKSVSAVTSGLKDSNNVDITKTVTSTVAATTFTYNENIYQVYILNGIDCSEGTGSMNVAVTVTSESELSATQTITVPVDNTPPVITVTQPSSSITQSGDVTAYGEIGESIKNVSFAVSPMGTVSPDKDSSTSFSWYGEKDGSGATSTTFNKTSGEIAEATAYKEITDATMAWYVYFNGNTESSLTTTRTDTFNTWLVKLGITTADAITNNSFTTVTYLYLWIKATDITGNVTEKAHLVKIDPQGNRPEVTIEYPVENSSSTLGGKVRIYGTATAKNAAAIKNVWIQIVSASHTNYTASGAYALAADATSVTNYVPKAEDMNYLVAAVGNDNTSTKYQILKMSDGTTQWSDSGKTDDEAPYYGIKATVSGSAWYIIINNYGELNPSSGTNVVGIRAYTIDSNGILSSVKTRSAVFDNDTPVISDVYLKQYSGSTVTASRKYTENMYVRGDWYIEGTVTDKDKVKSLLIDGQEQISTAAGSVSFKYDLGTASGVGTKSFTIKATDDASPESHSTTQTITVYYDNVAPSLIGTSDSGYNISPSVKQSNSFYTFSSKVNEPYNGGNQSGFSRLAFYFLRRNAVSKKAFVYDVMLDKKTSGNASEITGIKAGKNPASNGDIVYESGLYWKYESVTRDSLSTLTLTGEDANIHTKGLVKIGGSIYTISAISGTTVTLPEEVPTTYTAAYFALAMVVDNTVIENTGGSLQTSTGYGCGYYTSPSNDDGDRMIEGVTKSGTTWTWEANVCSKNIPDGPIELHYIAFDAAGNYTVGIVGNVNATTFRGYSESSNGYECTADTGEYTAANYAYTSPAFVSNNAPRIAAVLYGTDENGSGTVDSTELTYSDYYAITSGNKTYTASALKTAAALSHTLTVKGATAFVPEIVGGNGNLYYSYTATRSGGTSAYYTMSAGASIGTGSDYTGNGNESEVEDITVTLSEKDFLTTSTSNTTALASGGDGQTFVLKLWDSTEGTTAGTDSQYASITATLNMAILDKEAPTAVINPFYWTSSSDNSVYNNSGHIELSAGLPSTFTDSSTTYSSSYSKGEYDRDDKVSGAVIIEGTVHDNKLVTGIYAKIDGFTFSNSGTTINGYSCLATYNTTTSTWTSYGTYSTDGYQFLINGNTFTQSTGHTVSWKLILNTAKITTVAASDVNIIVRATDKGVASLENDAVSYAANTSAEPVAGTTERTSTAFPPTCWNRVDVVPYITGIATSLDTMLGKDYNRTSTGAYTVKVKSSNEKTYETITVSGYNLNPSTLSDTDSDIRLSKDGDAYENSARTGTELDGSDVDSVNYTSCKVTVKATGSGYLSIFTNGVVSLNNIASSTADYDKDSALVQKTLNDDRYLVLWDFTPLRSTVTNAGNAIYPSMAMKENTPQFAYVNNSNGYGLAEFYDGSKETKIYENWDLFTYTALALNGSNKRAALYDINVVRGGTGYASDSGGIMTNFFYDPPDTTWTGTTYYFRSNNVWMDNLATSDHTKAILDRYQYPAIKMIGDDSLSHVFYTTYDSIKDRIVFRYFRIGTNKTSVGSDAVAVNSGGTLYLNSSDLNQIMTDGKTPDYNESRRFTASDKNNTEYGGTTTEAQYFATGLGNGLYTAVAGISTGTDTARAVLVYYSGSTLYYMYATNDANTSWSTPVALDTSVGGDYVSMVADKDKHIHIAYQDSFAGDVKYIYIPAYDAPATRKKVTVDSYLTVGGKLTLTVSGNTPYISYKGLGNTAKIAWYTAESGTPDVNTLAAGATDDKFTGNWEVQVLPVRIVDSDSNRYNVGVGSDGRPVVGYSNGQSGSKGIEYVTKLAELSN